MLTIAGCQTSRPHEFESIHNGMAKDQVLAAVGGPNRTERRAGIDRWIYILWDRQSAQSQIKEVHFSEGQSTYVGAPIPARMSAEEQDHINSGALAERTNSNSVYELLNDSDDDREVSPTKTNR